MFRIIIQVKSARISTLGRVYKIYFNFSRINKKKKFVVSFMMKIIELKRYFLFTMIFPLHKTLIYRVTRYVKQKLKISF